MKSRTSSDNKRTHASAVAQRVFKAPKSRPKFKVNDTRLNVDPELGVEVLIVNGIPISFVRL